MGKAPDRMVRRYWGGQLAARLDADQPRRSPANPSSQTSPTPPRPIEAAARIGPLRAQGELRPSKAANALTTLLAAGERE